MDYTPSIGDLVEVTHGALREYIGEVGTVVGIQSRSPGLALAVVRFGPKFRNERAFHPCYLAPHGIPADLLPISDTEAILSVWRTLQHTESWSADTFDAIVRILALNGRVIIDEEV